MDIGVGSFVFSQGIVSAIPLLKNPKYLLLPFTPKIIGAVKKSAVVIMLGVIRMLLVKGVEYPVRSIVILSIDCILIEFTGT